MNFKRKSKIQNMIDKIRGKKPTMKKMLVNNVINVPKKLLKRVDINIDGENNRIEISENARVSGFLFIKIYGDNNVVKIADNVGITELKISIGQKHHNFFQKP